MKTVLITGSRDWNNLELIRKELNLIVESWGNEITILSGHCPTGADKMCEDVAKDLGWNIELYPADWSQYGKSAGFIRNRQMVNHGADICLAFIKNGSRGASGTAKLAEESGIETKRFREIYI